MRVIKFISRTILTALADLYLPLVVVTEPEKQIQIRKKDTRKKKCVFMKHINIRTLLFKMI